MAGVMYQGRRVSGHWYRRYVLGAAQRSITAQKKIKAAKPTAWVSFHMPAIPELDEGAETRLVCVTGYSQRDWVEEMSSNYAVLCPTRLTTFFQITPNRTKLFARPPSGNLSDINPTTSTQP